MKTIYLLFAMILTLSLQGWSAPKRVDLAEFDHVDPKRIVPDKPLRQALTYFKMYKKYFPNQDYIVLIDYTKHSSNDRMYLVNLKTGQVDTHLTAHGRGSDPRQTGYAKKFSNTPNSNASSLGFFRTAETYFGRRGYSLKLDGISPTNTQARARGIVIHGAWYVNERTGQAGRSHGCPALDPRKYVGVIKKIKRGALLYAWAGN